MILALFPVMIIKSAGSQLITFFVLVMRLLPVLIESVNLLTFILDILYTKVFYYLGTY